MITPGEWISTESMVIYALNEHGFNRFFAQVQPGQTGERVGGRDQRTSDEELHANAIMMAAAPDLADALKECADDLESELNEKYTAELRLYPSQQAKYNRDMKPVLAARAALQKAGVK